MSNYDYNAGADVGSMTVSLSGASFLEELDPLTDKPSGIAHSMGHSTGFVLNNAKEFKELSHTLFQKRTVTDTVELSSATSLVLTMQNFSAGIIAKLMNSKVVKKAGTLETKIVDASESDVESGFSIITDQAVGTLVVTDELDQTLVDGVHYVTNNSGVYILPVAEQEALITGVETAIVAGKITVENTGLSSETIDYDVGTAKNYRLTLCLFDGLDKKNMIKYVFHKVKISTESLPLKDDGDDEASYDIQVTALNSKFIKDPNESKVYYTSYSRLNQD